MAHDTDPARKKPKPDDDVYKLPDFPDIAELPESTAELALPDFVPSAEPESVVDDLPLPDGVEHYDPITPASGWLEVPTAAGDDFGEPTHAIESSDIFAGGPLARATAADHSDVLSATTGSPRSTPPSFPQSGDGTDSDLPLAEEVDIEESSLFPQAKHDDDDRPDFGATPPMSADASNILADLSNSAVKFDHDASGVRLDSPGMSRTLTDEPVPEEIHDGTAIEPVPRKLFPAGPAKSPPASSTDWKQQSGSDLFSDARTVSDDDDEVNPFTDDKPDQPSLSSAQSSIFSGGKIPGATGVSRGSDPVRDAPSPDAVDFSDHPDDEGSSILGVAPDDDAKTQPGDGGGVDFNLPPGRRGRDSQKSGIDSGSVDWTGAHQDSPSLAGKIDPGDDWIVADSPGTTPVPDNRPPKITAKGKPKTLASTPPKPKDRKLSDPSVVVDFVSQSAEESVMGMGKTSPKKAVAGKSGGGKGGWLGGGAVGLLAGVGTCAGLYFGGVIDNKPAATVAPLVQGGGPNGGGSRTGEPPVVAALPTMADAKRALTFGDPAAALKVLQTADTAEAKGARGQARFLVRVRDAAAIGADDAELKAAREDLQAAVDDPAADTNPEAQRTAVKAAIHLGLTHELSGNRADAKKVYEAAAQKFPKSADIFQAALDRLIATDADGGKTSLLPRDAEQLAFAATFLLTAAQEPAEAEEPAEAGGLFWKAMNAATAGKFIDAIEGIGKAKAAHQKRAKALAGRGLNPLSDPLEQIFPKCCDDLKAYWELRQAVYGHKFIAGAKTPAEVTKAIDRAAALETTEKATRKMLEEASDKLVLMGRESKIIGEKLSKVTEDLKLADAAQKTAEATVAAVAKELQGGKFLPEKFEPAAVLPAQKAAIARAGLAAGDLVQLTDRVKKSETAEKAATEKLATETKRLQDELTAGTKKLTDANAADTKKMTESHAAELKKLTDGYAADMKKMTDAHAVEIKKFTDNPIADKLKADHMVEVKKLTDAHTTAMKKATDDAAAEAKKLTDVNANKLKALEGAVAVEKDKLTVMTKKFEADLGNAISPTQALDVWMPLLNTARRPADADPAQAVAAKVLATAPATSEDAAKAMVVSGLASHIKGNVSTAKGMFATARQNPTYAATKDWAKIADVALGRIDDPSGGAVADAQKTNAAAGARLLDAGITAYKAGRYTDAVQSLSQSTANDGTNPLAWYYLGAARWQSGSRDLAASDFRTGAEKEANRTVSAKSIDAALAPIQGAVRDALTGARP